MLQLLVATSLSGCSLLAVAGPPPNHQSLRRVACSTGDTWPAIDVFMAAGYAIPTTVSALHVDSSTLKLALIATSVTTVLAHGGSAFYGWSVVGRCEEAQALARQRDPLLGGSASVSAQPTPKPVAPPLPTLDATPEASPAPPAPAGVPPTPTLPSAEGTHAPATAPAPNKQSHPAPATAH